MYDKRHACYFCDKIGRRHFDVHCDEAVIRLLSSLPPGDAGRQKQMQRFRLLGNFKHNSKVIRHEIEDNLIVERLSKARIIAENYLPCVHCFGFFHRRELHKHCKSCNFFYFQCERPIQSCTVVLLSIITTQQKSNFPLLLE